MKLRLSIAAKLGLGFGILTFALIINAFLTAKTLNENQRANEDITNVYDPTASQLKELTDMIKETRMLIRSWVFIDKKPETPDKLALVKIHQEHFPALDSAMNEISKNWKDDSLRIEYTSIASAIRDTLFPKHQYLMGMLSSFESYDDPLVVFEVVPMVEEGGEIVEITDRIITRLNILTAEQQNFVNEARIEMTNSFNSFRRFIVITGIILVIVSLVIAVLTTNSLATPINQVKEILLQMARGILPENKIPEGKDEIGQMSQALSGLLNGLRDTSNFSVEIGKGNFDSPFKPLSDEDVLGNALIDMRDELKKAASEEQKRKQEDDQRNWSTQGMAKFGEILRLNNDNITELSYNIISNLVKYLDANQGGLFLVNDSDASKQFIELSACYAYDRRKFLEKNIEIGEGLVGRCYLEKETIYMTDIPNDYINITSGLGSDNPRSLLIVPLIVNDEIYGVIELASFREFPKFQIEFIEKIAESIASTISTVRINMKTTTLLEQSQMQAEMMAAQEEEMRQNMEELRATQEQSERREQELRRELDSLKVKYAEVVDKLH